MDNLKIAVVGAGITGTTTAYSLIKRGHRVTVFDRNHYPAMETSFANGGQLSTSNAEVWNSWQTIFKGLKWMITPDAPLLMRPQPTWHKVSWIAEFIAATRRYEDNTIDTARLALDAREYLNAIAVDENIAFDREDRGILHFYHTKADFDVASEVTKLLVRAGLDRRSVSPSEIRTIEPTLRGAFYGGFFTPSDFSGDAHKFTLGLTKANRRLGVSYHFATEVSKTRLVDGGVVLNFRQGAGDHIETSDDRFDRIVVCGGVHSRALGAQLGDRINIYPVKGYSITVNLLERTDQEAAPRCGLLDDRSKIVTSRLGETRFRVAGTAEFNGYNRDIRDKRVRTLVAWCQRHFPGMSIRQTVPWAGLRPMTPDMMPRVRQGRHPAVFYNTGHGHLGWTLSAATAEVVAAMITAKTN